MELGARNAGPELTLGRWMRDNRLSVGLYVLVLGLVYCRIVWAMGTVWLNNDNYSHGFLVPLVSAYFLWAGRESLSRCPVRPAASGLLIVLFGVVLLLFASLASELFTQRASMIVVTAGAVVYALGWRAFRELRLPLLYLFLMIPIPVIVYDSLTLPMKTLVARLSVEGLLAVGLSVVREGNIIMLPNITLEVADACSGLRSLMSLLALSIAYAFLSQKIVWKRWLVVFSAFPIAIVANIMRVFVTGVLARYYGRAAAEGFFHEFAGTLVFLVALALLLALGAALRAGEVRK